ncbi:general secretion pathway protein C [Paracidovorax konjaci]|uniref:General secretion pathway protein C n=1 Tax=Paracidovorax konjaci TaxID=32040 RepID=A0A1I1VNS1_9BURK|nr:general secretion pathway protein C [Paracidovorax konjaci]SFD84465.1 general secretion pathway protein C [Paracidovorax konjaci]
MVTNTYGPWGVRLGTLALWVLAGASVVYWGLKLAVRPAPLSAPVAAPAPPQPDALALARLLGAGPAAPSAPAAREPSRYALQGVLAGTASGGGAALIAVDNQPARPFRLGATVAEGLVVQALGRRQVRLGPSATGETTVTLEVPEKGR